MFCKQAQLTDSPEYILVESYCGLSLGLHKEWVDPSSWEGILKSDRCTGLRSLPAAPVTPFGFLGWWEREKQLLLQQ